MCIEMMMIALFPFKSNIIFDWMLNSLEHVIMLLGCMTKYVSTIGEGVVLDIFTLF